MKRALLILSVALAALPASAAVPSAPTPPSAPTTTPLAPSAEAALLPVALAYINKHRLWMDGTYDVSFSAREGDLFVFDAVRKSDAEIKAVIIDQEVAQFQAAHPTSTPAIVSEFRKDFADVYDQSMSLQKILDPSPEIVAQAKHSFQILIDPVTATVTGERFF